MALSGDEIIKDSLLRPTGEEHRTSATPEEEATVLGKIELPQVPEQLGVHELVHPAEWIATPVASPPSPPSQPSCLPSQKAKKSQQVIKAKTTSAASGSMFT